MRKIIKIKVDKLRKDEFPVAVAVNDKYIVFSREYMTIKE